MSTVATPSNSAPPSPLQIDVVSIMSQVVYGQVGNSVTVPALQRFGLRVAAVPTVILSNTPHYPSVHGGALPLDWFQGYLDDLLARGALGHLRAVVLGFLGNPDQIDIVMPWLDKVKSMHGDLTVIIDPVIGDHDHGIYVDPALCRAYRERAVHYARGLIPNGFELGVLTGMPVDDVAEVVKAARQLLNGVTQWVIVTSAAPATWSDDTMKVLVVTASDSAVLAHKRLPLSPKGTGDLFAASVTARIINGSSITDAATHAYEDVLAALARTQAANCAELLLA